MCTPFLGLVNSSAGFALNPFSGPLFILPGFILAMPEFLFGTFGLSLLFGDRESFLNVAL